MSRTRHPEHKRKRAQRTLLGRVELDQRLVEQFQRSGLLEVTFSRSADVSLLSLDGNRTVVWLAPSGDIATLLVQDYVGAEGTRTIPFVFGDVEIHNDGIELAIYLRAKPRQ